MNKSTELGKILKNIMNMKDISQEKLGKELGVSESSISNYITGKSIPDMEFLLKCVNRFNIEGKDLRTLFSSAFFYSYKNNQKIIIDTRNFAEERIKPLITVITTLLLYQGKISFPPPITYHPNIVQLIENIETSLNESDNEKYLVLKQPT